jgi:hypothetical protein
MGPRWRISHPDDFPSGRFPIRTISHPDDFHLGVRRPDGKSPEWPLLPKE